MPPDDPQLQGAASALLGIAHLSAGELEPAYNAIVAGMERLREIGNIAFALSGTGILADIRAAQGRLNEAARVAATALQSLSPPGQPPLPGAADIHLYLSALRLQQGRAEEAREHLRTSETLGAAAALPDWRYRFHLAQARLAEAEGDWQGALNRLDEAERVFYPSPMPDPQPVPAWRARLGLRQGRPDGALTWARQAGLSPEDEPGYAREFEYITLARALLAHHQLHGNETAGRQAASLLERLLASAESGGRAGSAIEIRVLLALARQALGDTDRALAALAPALALAEPEGYVRLFTAEGPPMAQLLAMMNLERGTRNEFASRLLAAMEGTGDTPHSSFAIPHSASTIPGLPEPLTGRELEILRLVAEGLSNQAISQRLFLALNTVKGHNQRIFDKLQVQRRTEAVARARELGLV
jgi:LuxR family maltose regulon positive regulatory protein